MINGEKLPYEEYILDLHKMVQLNEQEQRMVAISVNNRIERICAEQKLTYEEAKNCVLNQYKKMRDENMLPRAYVIEDAPDYMEKLMAYSLQGIRNVTILTAEEYDRRNAYTIAYMATGEVI